MDTYVSDEGLERLRDVIPRLDYVCANRLDKA